MTEEKNSTSIYGIDLGTTYSCIAYIDKFGTAVVIRNEEGEFSTPSVVQFEDDNVIVGSQAKNNAFMEPDAIVEMAKRHMGEPGWSFTFHGKSHSAEQISSYILRKLARDAEEKLEQPVKEVVISCPAYFGIAQREATRRAGELAGLIVREIINEPTAAALTYGIQHEQSQVILVYDLGGGTLDVTVNEIKDKTVTVVAITGDRVLGGRDWDKEIVQYFVEQWQQKTGLDDDPLQDEETQQDLWIRAERTKIALSKLMQTKEAVRHNGNNKRVTVFMTREEFELRTAHLLEKTISITCEAIEAARRKGVVHIDKILLVGGSTHMPQVKSRLAQEFAIPIMMFDPDEAVAKGTALYGKKIQIGERIQEIMKEDANISLKDAQRRISEEEGLSMGLVGPLGNTVIMNVASHSFGIVMVIDYGTPQSRNMISNLIKVNDPLPKQQEKLYGTVYDNQTMVELQIMETLNMSDVIESKDYSPLQQIGVIYLNLPPGLPAHTTIKVQFELDRQGLLHVAAKEESSNSQVETSIKIKGIS